MRKDKKLAIRLRRDGKSYSQIRNALGVPKSTLATWFKDDRLSEKIKKILTEQARKNSSRRIKKLAQANKVKWEKWREEAREEARKEFAELAQNQLFIAGIMLYWAEGDGKLKNPFRFTNTDPRMVKLYIHFITRILGVPRKKIRPTIILYPDLSENECLKFWSGVMRIPASQFYKTQFIKGKHPTQRLSRGICMIMCGNRQLKEKVVVWIDLTSQKLIQ